MVHAAGIPDFSRKALNSASARPRMTPCPKMTKGRSAALMSAAASSTNDGLGAVAADVPAGGVAAVFEGLQLRVLGDVDEHGAGSSASGDVEGLGEDGGELRRIGHLVVPFGDGRGDVDHVGLLEGVGAEQVCEDLAGDAYHGCGVDHRVGEARDEVGGARAAGGEDDAGATGGAGIALGGVNAPLFVPHQDMLESVAVSVEGVIDGHDGAAGVAEDGGDAFGHEGFADGFGAGEGPGQGALDGLCRRLASCVHGRLC
jgi:hypothetical protein